MMTEHKLHNNPYVGPRPFERNAQDQGRFFGRDRETQEIVSLIYGHPLLLVYAQSGAGKTSLFNARIAPTLEAQGFEVLPLTRIHGIVPQDIDPRDIGNPYVFSALQRWETEVDPEALVGQSLREYLEKRPRHSDARGQPAPRAIVFDQFEELFTLYPERQHERQGDFFSQVNEALNADPLLRCVFVIREDYVAQLDPFAPHLPEGLRIRFRLERLRREAALAAITIPLQGTERAFAEGAAEQLVDDLLEIQVQTIAGETTVVIGEFVEPVQLQVVCQTLWRDLPPDVTVITRDHLQAFGDVNQALSTFYEWCITEVIRQSGTEEGDLRRWFERTLITPARTRGTVYRGREETDEISNIAVDILESLHLVRSEWRAGARWYELTHDRFIEPIQESNQAWRALWGEADQIRLWLQDTTVQWRQGDRGLLDDVELRRLDTESWLTSPFFNRMTADSRALIVHSAIQRGLNIEKWIGRLASASEISNLMRALLLDPEETTRLNAARGWEYMPSGSEGNTALIRVSLNDPAEPVRAQAATTLARRNAQQAVPQILAGPKASPLRRLEALARVWDETVPLWRSLPLGFCLQVVLVLIGLRLKRSGRALLYHSVAGIAGGVVTGILFGLIVAPIHWVVDSEMWNLVGFSLQGVIAAWIVMGPWFAGTLGTAMIVSSTLPLVLFKRPKRWLVLLASALLAGMTMSVMLIIVYQGNFLRGALWHAALNGFVIGSLMGCSVAELFYRRWSKGSMSPTLVGVSFGVGAGLLAGVITSFFPPRHDALFTWVTGITVGSTLIIGGVNLAVKQADRFIEGLSALERKGGWFK